MLNNRNFNVPDMQFKTIIASSLPPSWDIFTDPYMGSQPGTRAEVDTRGSVQTQEFIGIIKEEYLQRKTRADTTIQHHSYQSSQSKQSLANQLKEPGNSSLRCRNCNLIGHLTDDCKWLGQIKCRECGWFGHMAKDCRRKGKGKRKASGDTQGDQGKKKQKESTNQAHDDSSSNKGNLSAECSVTKKLLS
jgi:Zinc knuckle